MNRFSRNRDLINQELLDRICIIGMGSIGSCVIQDVTIMGFRNILLYDDDILEKHNLSSTKYSEEYLGYDKVFAAKLEANRYNGATNIIWRTAKFEEGMELCPITIVCTDNMESRKLVHEEWLKLEDRIVLIDIRMDSLVLEIITITKNNDDYTKYWVDGSEITDAPCTMKHTIFTTSIAAGMGVNSLFSVLMNIPYWMYQWIALSPLTIETDNLISKGARNA